MLEMNAGVENAKVIKKKYHLRLKADEDVGSEMPNGTMKELAGDVN
jgi:hypothetical protein